jgi:hypothetical protein
MRSLARVVLWRLGAVRIAPWALDGETSVLLRHARGKRRLAEIGVWEGGTTRALREVMHPEGTLFAVDPFFGGRLGISYQKAIAHGEVAKVRNGRVVWIRERGERAAADPRVAGEPFDFVFLDGDHTYDGTAAAWHAWKPLANGIVALHDALGDPGQGSIRFVAEHVLTDPDFEPVDRHGCLLVLKRKIP